MKQPLSRSVKDNIIVSFIVFILEAPAEGYAARRVTVVATLMVARSPYFYCLVVVVTRGSSFVVVSSTN